MDIQFDPCCFQKSFIVREAVGPPYFKNLKAAQIECHTCSLQNHRVHIVQKQNHFSSSAITLPQVPHGLSLIASSSFC